MTEVMAPMSRVMIIMLANISARVNPDRMQDRIRGIMVCWVGAVTAGLPARSPDPLAAVVKVEFESPPYAVTEIGAEWLDGALKVPSPR